MALTTKNNTDNSDILTIIPETDLPDLRDKYRCGDPRHSEALSLLSTAILLKKDEKTKNRIVLYSPNGCHKEDGTFIAFLKFSGREVFVSSLDEKGSNLYKGLDESELINYKNTIYFFSVDVLFIPVLKQIVESKNLTVTKTLNDFKKYALNKNVAASYDVSCPLGYSIKKIGLSYTKFINDNWDFNYPNSDRYVRDLIFVTGCYGIFENNAQQPIGWVMKGATGQIHQLKILESDRGKGFAQLIIKYISKKIAEENDTNVCATIHESNTASLSLFEKLGFVMVGRSDYMCVK